MPAPLPDPKVGAVGLAFIATFRDEAGAIIDVSTATLKQIRFRKPVTATSVEQTAAFDTNGVDGKTKYVTLAGDLDEPGWWEYEGYVELASGAKWATVTYRVNIAPRIPAPS